MRELSILAASLGYLALLFLVAWWGDRRKRVPGSAPVVYSLGIGVYCTSWTFYGAVGEAAQNGFDYLPIYIGPSLVIILGWPLVTRMIRIARAENVVSISDFISARYGKSRALAVLVTLCAVVGLLPYFALQLKAITLSFAALTGDTGAAGGLPGGTTFVITVAMAVFCVLFGVRSVNATEHHRGLMLAVATESAVKLAAALGVGLAITLFALAGGPGEIVARVRADPDLLRLVDFDPGRPVWWTTCLLSALAFLCLPRQFHVAVLENTDPADVRTAAWAFPLYLLAISFLVLPVAMAGLILFPDGSVQPDTFMVAIPAELGWSWLGLIAFLGGLSASTGMILVGTLALGTMLGNDVVVPLLGASRRFRARWAEDPAPLLLAVRRLAMATILVLAYGVYNVIGPAFPLARIGLISFTAVAQFAPALLGGLVWRRGTAAGAFTGIAVGFGFWLYTVVVPAFATAGWLSHDLLAAGPFGIAALSPVALAGTTLDPLTHAALWSLVPNLLAYVGVSLLAEPDWAEAQQAERFVALRSHAPTPDGARSASFADLHRLAARFVGEARTDAALGPLGQLDEIPGRVTLESIDSAERLIASAIGAASARVVVAGLISGRRISRSDARELIDDASRAILSRHELMRDALENVRQGFCVFDAELRVQLWNPQFLRLNDLPPELIRVGAPLAEIVGFNEARGEYGQHGEFDSLLARRLDPARRGRADVYERRRPDGTMLEVATNPLPSGGFVAVYTDVTERQRAAAELRAVNESLEERIGERTVALTAAKAEAERANLGKTRFMAGVGHDLLQPLQAARLFLSALAERSTDPAVGQIDASLHSVEHLLGELLEVSKLDSGVTTPEPADVRVADVLRPLGAEFALLARQHGLELRLVPSAASVRSDPAMLRRILQNFLVNAVRYTPRGRILVGCRRRGDALSIEVWDTGVGIPADKLREIFIEFHQLESATPARGQGLGLGLAIVERLAGLLDHPLDVRSTPGRGSVFAVRVPLAAAPVAQPRREARAHSFAGTLVLLIENEPAIAEAMRDLLGGWSARVVAAPDAETALAALAGAIPDVILSDYHLDAGRTGLEALAILRARLAADPPAALITADRAPAIRAAAEAAGARLLHKPVRPGALRALLAQMLAERASRAAE
jgi:Na+/proline symporter/signal transduction histidine kinase